MNSTGGADMASAQEFLKADVDNILAKYVLNSSYEEISEAINEAAQKPNRDRIFPSDFKRVLRMICQATNDDLEKVISLLLSGEVIFVNTFLQELDEALREKRADHPAVKRFN